MAIVLVILALLPLLIQLIQWLAHKPTPTKRQAALLSRLRGHAEKFSSQCDAMGIKAADVSEDYE